MLRDDVDTAFFRFSQVCERVFSVIKTSAVADGEEWWVVVRQAEVGKWSQVGGFSVFGDGTDKANRSWCNT